MRLSGLGNLLALAPKAPGSEGGLSLGLCDVAVELRLIERVGEAVVPVLRCDVHRDIVGLAELDELPCVDDPAVPAILQPEDHRVILACPNVAEHPQVLSAGLLREFTRTDVVVDVDAVVGNGPYLR